MITYREHAPDPRLTPWIRCLWELRTAASCCAGRDRVLPDGCVEWVFHLGPSFQLEHSDGSLERQATGLVVGATTRAVLLHPSRGADVLGVRFRPGGAHAFMRGSVEDWTDRIVSMDALEDRTLVELHGRLRDASPTARLSLLEEGLLARAARIERKGRPLSAPVEALLSGRLDVDGAARLNGVGARQLQRRFRREVGLGPRTLARLGRLQRASALLVGGVPATVVAHAAGFSDQAHLGRDFRAICGTTPAAFQHEARPAGTLGSAFAAVD